MLKETMLKPAWRCTFQKLFVGILFLVSTSLSLHAGLPVTLTLLDGATRTGELQNLTIDDIEVNTDQGLEKIAASQLMMVDLNPEGAAGEAPQIGIVLADHSSLQLSTFTSDGTQAILVTPDLPAVSVPIRQISVVRLAELDDKIAPRWEDLTGRNARDDLLVIRKGDVLDYVAGSISKVTADAVTVLVREKELSAPREKIFGLIFASRPTPPQVRRIAVRTRTGDILQSESLKLVEDRLQITSSSLGELSLPLESIQSLDFGGGRIRSLADLPFDSSGSKPPHENDPVVWFVCRNAPAGSGGKLPLTIGEKEYRKGLWLHSGAALRFRLNREFTRLRTTAGFDLTHVTRMPRFNPRVRLVLLGDGKELYSKEFLWNDAPEQLDVSLAEVRELTIRVDTAGSGQGILEHFALGDAQVIQ